MTEEELRTFLAERIDTPERVSQIVDSLSPKEVQALAVRFRRPVPNEVTAEEIAKRNRAKFAETIRIHEAGGIPWDIVDQGLS